MTSTSCKEVHLERGFVFIINDSERVGNDKDVDKLCDTFQSLNFTTELWAGTSKKEIENQMERIMGPEWEKKFENADCVIMVCMGHGFEDGQVFDCLDLQQLLVNPLCEIKSLHGKLKLLISQNCRGDHCRLDMTNEADNDEDSDEFDLNYTLMWFSTSEGDLSVRTDNGTPFIQQVCKDLVSGASRRWDVVKIIDTLKLPIIKNRVQNPTYTLSFNTEEIKFYLPQVSE